MGAMSGVQSTKNGFHDFSPEGSCLVTQPGNCDIPFKFLPLYIFIDIFVYCSMRY